MRLDELTPPKGATKKRKRVGRGIGSGHGKTACRGSKGQNSRAGRGTKAGFEGGQMPLQRRLPKRGFHSVFKKEYALVNLSALDDFEEGATVTPEELAQKGLIKKALKGVKILGDG